MITRRVSATVAVIQARMGSSRLPGKVLDTIDGLPMLQRVAERVSAATSVDHVVVATSAEPGDRVIVEFCRARGIPVSATRAEGDVLGRCVDAVTRLAPQSPVVRITADCPLVDPALIDRVVEAFQRGCDYASNVWPTRTFPDGLDVEVVSAACLRRMDAAAVAADDREHVTRWAHRHARALVMRTVTEPAALALERLRWTVDTADDLEFIRTVYRHFAPRRVFGWGEVLAVPAFASREGA